MVARHGLVYFTAETPKTGLEIFVSDGTAQGTRLFLETIAGTGSGVPWDLSAVGSRSSTIDRLPRGGLGVESVRTDGTAKGTVVLDANVGPGQSLSYILSAANRFHTALGEQVLFPGTHATLGTELFVVDNGATSEPIGSSSGRCWLHGSDPVMGSQASIRCGADLANAVHVTLVARQALPPSPFGKTGWLHLDFQAYVGLIGVATGPTYTHTIPVPNSPTMNKVKVLFQTFSIDPQQLQMSLILSNGLHWTFGN